MRCPTCGSEVASAVRFCPSCGRPVDFDATVSLEAGANPPKRSPSARSRTSSSSDYEARYVPGTTLAGRYRIVSPLGKGGMGEVYRAEDLRLGQTVALKFLPRSLAQTEEALERFRLEVRLARQVSHPNVCRVFDIGEISENGDAGKNFTHTFPPALSPDDSRFGMVRRDRTGGNFADRYDGVLWLLHLPGRPTGFRRGHARGVN
jgi:serine/threonine protein kinase